MTCDNKHMEEDVWGGSDDELDTKQRDKEWNKMEDRYMDEGYREGISFGKESHLQSGFDEGYTVGVVYGREYGRLRAFANQTLSLLAGNDNGADNGLVERARNLVGSVGRVGAQQILPKDIEAIEHAREHEQAEQAATHKSKISFNEELGGERGRQRDIDHITAELDRLGEAVDGRVLLDGLWMELRLLVTESATLRPLLDSL